VVALLASVVSLAASGLELGAQPVALGARTCLSLYRDAGRLLCLVRSHALRVGGGVLGEWVPRDELEAEVERRLEAQQGVRKREVDLAGLRAELDQLHSEMRMLAHGAANAENEARALRMHRAALIAERDVARAQRDEAVRAHDELAKQLQGLQSRLEAMRRTGASVLFGQVFSSLFGGAQETGLGAMVGATVISGSTGSIATSAPTSMPGASSPSIVDSVQEITRSAGAPRKGPIELGPVDVAAAGPPVAAVEFVREVPPSRSATRNKGGKATKRRGTR
jgi:hypothetical protein